MYIYSYMYLYTYVQMQVARLAISSRALLSRHAAASLPSISVLGEW